MTTVVLPAAFGWYLLSLIATVILMTVLGARVVSYPEMGPLTIIIGSALT